MEAKIIILLCRAAFSAFCAFGMHRRIARTQRVIDLGRGLESALGFRQGSFHVPGDTSPPYHKVVIRSVERGGVFERAGIRAGDVLPDLRGSALPELPSTALFELLVDNRGGTVELAAINIADLDDDGLPFADRPRRKFSVAVPAQVTSATRSLPCPTTESSVRS